MTPGVLLLLPEMVEGDGTFSNQLFDVLADWNAALQDCESMLPAGMTPSPPEI